jgi:signal peptidase II
MRRWHKLLLVIVTIASCVGCDQVTKLMAKRYLPRHKIVSVAGGIVKFDYVVNRGGVLTFEDYMPERWRGRFFSAGVIFVVGLILAYLILSSSMRPLPALSLSLICGGILSNLLDRLAFTGDVVDFLSIGWGALRSGIFNLADLAIAAGVVLLAWSLVCKFRRLLHKKRPSTPR